MRYAGIVVLFTGLTLSLAARADFTGSWSGSGDVSGGFNIHCDTVSVDVAQTATQLSLTNGVADCGFISESMTDQTFQIQGNQLWQNGQQVGTITDTGANATVSGKNYTGDVSLSLTAPDTVDITADIDRNGSTYHVTGTLQRQ